MGGPNRKLRRAMEAQTRKASRGLAMNPDVLREVQKWQNMYDQKVLQLAELSAELSKFRAIAAGLMVEGDVEEVVLTVGTIQALQAGVIADINRVINKDGSVTVSLLFGEEVDDGYGNDEEE